MTDPRILPAPLIPPAPNLRAVCSLVFGILAWVILPILAALIAIILGHVARGELRRLPPVERRGEGMALAGLILGYAQLVLGVIGLAVVIFVLHGLALSAHR